MNKIILAKLNGRAEVLLCPNQNGGAATPPYHGGRPQGHPLNPAFSPMGEKVAAGRMRGHSATQHSYQMEANHE